MSVYNEYGKRKEEQIRPASSIIAVKMLESLDDIPSGAKRPIEDYGKCMATCQAFALTKNTARS